MNSAKRFQVSLAVAFGMVGLLLGLPSHAVQKLTVAMETLPRSGNPFSSTSIVDLGYWSAFYDPLTLMTTEGELLPWLAQSWRPISPTVWEFTLREGVTFSNGRKLDTASVAAAIAYLKSERGKIDPVARDLMNIESMRVVSNRVFELQTRSPDPLLPRRLSILRLIEPQAWTELGPEAYALKPIGTGPYVVDAVRADRVRLSAYANSWRKAPTPELEFVVSSDPAARQAALQVGDVDIALNAMSPDEFEPLRRAGGTIFTDRIPAVVSLTLNTVKDTPFRDERVRKAITMAVNREGIVSELLGGETTVAHQPATQGMFGYDAQLSPLPYDPVRAKKLLTDAGYPNGFAFDMEMPASKILYMSVFQAIAADLRKVGVIMTVRQLPQASFQEKVVAGGWSGSAFAWPFFSPTADPLYAMQYHSCAWPAAWYCDQAASRLIEAALVETDLTVRNKQTMDIMKRAHDTAQALFLYESVSFVGLGPRVKTFRADYGFTRFELIELKSTY